MQFMIIEEFKPGQKPRIYERLREKGRMLPDGLKYLDSWVEKDGDRCYQLMETDKEELLNVWTSNWDDLIEFEVVPIASSPVTSSPVTSSQRVTASHRDAPRTAFFTIDDNNKRRAGTNRSWLEFLDLPTMSMGIYHVAAGTTDRETHDPHDRDEVYVGVSGKGRLTAAGDSFDVEAGVIVYVKAGVEHHFHDVIDDLTVLVFFSATM